MSRRGGEEPDGTPAGPGAGAGGPPAPDREAVPDAEALARHYRRFGVDQRVLLTGHAHQAWPDVAFQAQQKAWLDAAELVDDKWERAYARAEEVRRGWRRLLDDDSSGEIALGASTHDLLVQFLSALPWKRRRTVLTTDAEFHTVRRQLDRLDEAGWVGVRRVPGRPVEGVVDRLVHDLGRRPDDTACVILSTVYYETAEIVPGLGELAAACRRHGVPLLLDTYQHLNAVPFSLPEEGLEDVWVTGGGYKYCQLGEGNCFLRFPADARPRPVVTGWFTESEPRDEPDRPHRVPYGAGAARFMGATYDPVSHYRAAAVFRFFEREGLTPEVLRRISRRQVGRLAGGLSGLVGQEALPGLRRGPEGVAGFLAIRLPGAGTVRDALRERGIRADTRRDLLRLGPAPYVSDAQLDAAVAALAEILEG